MAANIGKNLKVGRQYHDAMRVAALRRGVDMRTLTEEVCELWLAANYPDVLLRVFVVPVEPISSLVVLPPAPQPRGRQRGKS